MASWSNRPVRSARWQHWNEIRKNALWIVPTFAVASAIVASNVTLALDDALSVDPEVEQYFTTNVDDARTVVSTIAASMLTFMGVVFSISLVALQLASTQYSPRVVRTFVRSPVMKWTLAVFLATFTYSFSTLASFEAHTEQDPFVPALSVACAFLSVLVSLFVFIVFAHRIVRSMRVTYLIEQITGETRRAIPSYFGDGGPRSAVPELGEPDARVLHRGRGGVIAGIELDRLVELARRADVVLVIPLRIGTYLAEGSTLVEIHGRGVVHERKIRSSFDLGVERTLYQDPSYGIRQLVDVAIRALSPAVNDPTTAVQVIDRLTDLLARILARPDPTPVLVDASGVARVVRTVRSPDDVLDLAFTEIRHYGADSPQVTRRIVAACDELEAILPAERLASIDRQRALLAAEVRHAVVDGGRTSALHADAVGLG